MKRLLVLFVAAGLTTAVQAQSTSLSSDEKKVEKTERAKTPEERAKMKSQRMTKELGLTPEQEKAVYEVLLSQNTDRERHQMQREEARKRAEASRERSEQRILEILDDDQKELWEKKKAEIQENRRERVKHRREYRERRTQPERMNSSGGLNQKDEER